MLLYPPDFIVDFPLFLPYLYLPPRCQTHYVSTCAFEWLYCTFYTPPHSPSPSLSPTISDKLISVQKLYKKNPAEVEEDEDGAAVAGSGERCLDQAQVGLLVASVGRRYIDT